VTEAELLAALPDLAFAAVLAFCRIGAAVMMLPGLGEAELPAPVRLGLGLALAAALLPGLRSSLPAVPDAVAEAARLVAIEVAIGIWIGGLARVLSLALAMTGQAIALLMGLGGLLLPDTQLGAQATAPARMFGLLAAVLVLSGGLHALPLHAFWGSYALLPPGAPFPSGAAAEALAHAGAQSLGLALRLAAPFLLGAVLVNLALGLLARLAPQVQTFFVAVPGQILGGLALIGLLAPLMLSLFAAALRDGFLRLPGLG
jgi:flagellar biosynthetic protein FliR